MQSSCNSVTVPLRPFTNPLFKFQVINTLAFFFKANMCGAPQCQRIFLSSESSDM